MSRQQLKKLALLAASLAFAGTLTVSIQAFAKEEGLSALPLEELRTFAEVFGRIKQDYVEPVEDNKLIDNAIRGMLVGLDPHSDYMSPDEFKDLREKTQGEFGGLGIEITAEDGLVKVIAPYEDTPAQKAGIKSGDFIVKIDDAPVRGMSLNEAMKRMRGKPGTKVTLTIARKNESHPVVLTLTRAIIRTKSIKYAMLEPGYAYVRITQFQERTAENLADALQTLYKNGPLKGLILDLRDNPGGLLNGAVAVTAAFVPQDSLVVYTDGRSPDSKLRLTASPQNYVYENGKNPLAHLPAAARSVPIAVLVNGGTASASEIVAGALQDSKRSLIIGTQTFGKGSVQSIIGLANKAGIRLTTARYFTPSGRSIQAKGITPDIIVEDSNPDDQVFNIREADLDNHLANPNGDDTNTAPKRQPVVEKAPPSSTPKDSAHRPRSDAPDINNDYPLNQALNALKIEALVSKRNQNSSINQENKP